MNVTIASPLASYVGGARMVQAHGATLDEVLHDLDRRHPGIRFRIIDERGQLRRHLKLFVDGVSVEALDTPIRTSEPVHIVAALSGG